MGDWKQDFLIFGKRLRTLRERKGLTAAQVAENLQIPLSTYREWENGRAIRCLPYPLLAEIFQISLHELMTGKKVEKDEVIKALSSLKKDLDLLQQKLLSLI